MLPQPPCDHLSYASTRLSLGWLLLAINSAIAAWVGELVHVDSMALGCAVNTLDSLLGKTKPQGSLTGSANGDGMLVVVLYSIVFVEIVAGEDPRE